MCFLHSGSTSALRAIQALPSCTEPLRLSSRCESANILKPFTSYHRTAARSHSETVTSLCTAAPCSKQVRDKALRRFSTDAHNSLKVLGQLTVSEQDLESLTDSHRGLTGCTAECVLAASVRRMWLTDHEKAHYIPIGCQSTFDLLLGDLRLQYMPRMAEKLRRLSLAKSAGS